MNKYSQEPNASTNGIGACSEHTAKKNSIIRAIKQLMDEVQFSLNNSREKSLAFTKLQEATHWVEEIKE